MKPKQHKSSLIRDIYHKNDRWMDIRYKPAEGSKKPPSKNPGNPATSNLTNSVLALQVELWNPI